jgi:hypothetical protein
MSFKPYKSYNFKDKDPIIDQLRTIVSDAGATYREINHASGVSVSAIYNWFEGPTCRPTHAAVAAVAAAFGYDMHFVKRRGAKVIKLEPQRRANAREN